jgi:hypothetical protein
LVFSKRNGERKQRKLDAGPATQRTNDPLSEGRRDGIEMEVREERNAKLEALNGHFSGQLLEASRRKDFPLRLKGEFPFRGDGLPDSGFRRRMPRTKLVRTTAR